MLKIINDFNPSQVFNSSKGIYLTPIYSLELYLGKYAKKNKKFLEPKRTQVFPLKIQYQKELIDFFKKVHMMSNSIVQFTF